MTTYKDPVTNLDTVFSLIQTGEPEVEILNNDIPVAQIATATETGSSVSTVTSTLGPATDVLGFLGVVMSADQTGATLKFSQISKLISRLRYVDINFGQLFGGFLNGLGNAFDKNTSFDATTAFNAKQGEELEELIELAKTRIKLQNRLQNGRKGKFNVYLVDFFLIGKTDKGWMHNLIEKEEKTRLRDEENGRKLQGTTTAPRKILSGFSFSQLMEEIKYWIFLVSWLNKIVLMKLIAHKQSTKDVTPGFVTYVSFSQKIHFVLFNLVSIDVMFLGTRTLLHTKITRTIGFYFLWTLIIYNLVILDLLQIAYMTSTLLYSTYKKIQKLTGKVALTDDEIKQQEEDKKLEDSQLALRNHEVSKLSFAK